MTTANEIAYTTWETTHVLDTSPPKRFNRTVHLARAKKSTPKPPTRKQRITDAMRMLAMLDAVQHLHNEHTNSNFWIDGRETKLSKIGTKFDTAAENLRDEAERVLRVLTSRGKVDLTKALVEAAK